MTNEETIPTGVTLEDCFEAREREAVKPSGLSIFCAWLTGLLMGLVVFVLAAGVSGCVYRGAKITEGTDLAIGLTVPGTDGAVSLDILNYLSGFRLGVAENARLTVAYTTAETNSYFGCVTTCGRKTVRATVEPCELTSPSTDESAPSADGERPNEDVGNNP